jgi:predicted transposase/invertase (TIGR01784 family)
LNKKERKINKYDISLKDVFSGLEVEFTKAFLGFEIKEAEALNVELQKIEEVKADYICKIKDNEDKEFILHIEFQSDNHRQMHIRMLRYLTELHKRYKLPVIQFVVYVGRNKMNMKSKIEFENYQTKIDYQYKIINTSELDCSEFLNSDSDDLVALAILCDFKDRDKREVVHKITQRLEELSSGDYKRFRDKFLKLEVFSNLRDLTDIVKEEEKMITDKIKVENLPSYQIGQEVGVNQGINQEKLHIAKNLILKRLDVDFIVDTTGLSIDKVKELKESMSKDNNKY